MITVQRERERESTHALPRYCMHKIIIRLEHTLSKGRLPDLPVNIRLGLKPIFQIDYFCKKF